MSAEAQPAEAETLATVITEAECPECLEWSRIAPTGPYLAPVDYGEDGEPTLAAVNGPWWWTDEAGDANEGPAGCPRCGAIVLPETECAHRERGGHDPLADEPDEVWAGTPDSALAGSES